MTKIMEFSGLSVDEVLEKAVREFNSFRRGERWAPVEIGTLVELHGRQGFACRAVVVESEAGSLGTMLRLYYRKNIIMGGEPEGNDGFSEYRQQERLRADLERAYGDGTAEDDEIYTVVTLLRVIEDHDED